MSWQAQRQQAAATAKAAKAAKAGAAVEPQPAFFLCSHVQVTSLLVGATHSQGGASVIHTLDPTVTPLILIHAPSIQQPARGPIYESMRLLGTSRPKP